MRGWLRALERRPDPGRAVLVRPFACLSRRGGVFLQRGLRIGLLGLFAWGIRAPDGLFL